tara:strand:+ start:1346 stop:1939 length:594 start_codon:yes stop_codon:yes gene_type:complete
MLRIGVSVEGATEREFVSLVLVPYFLNKNKFLQPVDMRGNVSLDKIRAELKPMLNSFDYTTTLYDFYGFKNRSGRNISELEEAMLELVPSNKKSCFIPYVQLHEFEALLFSTADAMPEYFSEPGKTESVRSILSACGNPEAINDGYETCPSRRVSGLFPEFDKKLDGPMICGEIGLDKIREACPRFDSWLTKLEEIS